MATWCWIWEAADCNPHTDYLPHSQGLLALEVVKFSTYSVRLLPNFQMLNPVYFKNSCIQTITHTKQVPVMTPSLQCLGRGWVESKHLGRGMLLSQFLGIKRFCCGQFQVSNVILSVGLQREEHDELLAARWSLLATSPWTKMVSLPRTPHQWLLPGQRPCVLHPLFCWLQGRIQCCQWSESIPAGPHTWWGGWQTVSDLY